MSLASIRKGHLARSILHKKCIIYKDRRLYKKILAWRKHENEHVNKYVCMLRGPLDEIHSCVKCCLC